MLEELLSEEGEIDQKVKQTLETTYNGLKDSGKSITNSAQLIDFFVHDILDYAVLKGKKQNFTKNISIFDIEDCIQGVIQILNDKASMKNIDIFTRFEGFQKSILTKINKDGSENVKAVLYVKTDKKRVQ